MRLPNTRTLALTALLSLTLAASAMAQGFKTETWYAGPRIWVGNLNGAVAIGGQIERGFTKPGAYGPGVIAGGVGVDWYSWSDEFLGGKYSYTVVPVQVFANYHFPIQNSPKLDPYFGLGLVYSHVSSSFSGSTIVGSASGSTTDIAGNAGLRYFISDKFAVQGQLGFGYGTLALGATWKF